MKRSGLGRGLESLIPAEIKSGGRSVQEVPISKIKPNPNQPRKVFDEKAMSELAASIREVGILQPILVRETTEPGVFELIAGERRLRAAERAGVQLIPVVVQQVDDNGSLERALIENIQRSDLNPIEEAQAYLVLTETRGLTHEEIARKLGKSRASITNTMRLLQLPASVQSLIVGGKLSQGHARALLGIADRNLQEELAIKAVNENLSVRQVEDLIKLKREPVESHREEDLQSELSGDPRYSNEVSSKKPVINEAKPAGIAELESLLENKLNTRVKVEIGRNNIGKITISFADLEDLERIYRVMFS